MSRRDGFAQGVTSTCTVGIIDGSDGKARNETWHSGTRVLSGACGRAGLSVGPLLIGDAGCGNGVASSISSGYHLLR